MYKSAVLGLAALALGGCVTATNTLAVEDVATFKLTGVAVRFAPDTLIYWGDGERAYAASKGQPATESENLAKTPEGQAYLRNSIAGRVKAAMERALSSKLTGTRPVRIDVTVKSVVIPGAIQRVLIGGHHQMTADVTVVDAKTGAVIMPYAAQSALAVAGGGVGGVLFDSVALKDPVDRVVYNYAEQYAGWLTKDMSCKAVFASAGSSLPPC